MARVKAEYLGKAYVMDLYFTTVKTGSYPLMGEFKSSQRLIYYKLFPLNK